jgi:hypothetical protein
MNQDQLGLRESPSSSSIKKFTNIQIRDSGKTKRELMETTIFSNGMHCSALLDLSRCRTFVASHPSAHRNYFQMQHCRQWRQWRVATNFAGSLSPPFERLMLLQERLANKRGSSRSHLLQGKSHQLLARYRDHDLNYSPATLSLHCLPKSFYSAVKILGENKAADHCNGLKP